MAPPGVEKLLLTSAFCFVVLSRLFGNGELVYGKKKIPLNSSGEADPIERFFSLLGQEKVDSSIKSHVRQYSSPPVSNGSESRSVAILSMKQLYPNEVLKNCAVIGRYREGIWISCSELYNIPTAAELAMLAHSNTILFLSFNHLRLRKLRKYSFVTFHELMKLSIVHSELTLIEEDAFMGLHNLTSLTIQTAHRNYPVNISRGIFKPLGKLKYLNLKYTRLSVSSLSQAFCSVSSDISHMILDHVFYYSPSRSVVELDMLFDCLNASNLQVLSMKRNNLVRVTRRALSRLMSLRCISFRCNKIMGDRDAQLTALLMINLTSIDMGNQRIWDCAEPTDFPDFPSSLDPCRYKDDFDSYMQRELTSANEDAKWQILPNLRSLRLDHLETKQLNANLTRYPLCVKKLQILDLSYMNVKNITGVPQCFEHLMYLGLRGVNPSYIDTRFFRSAKSLKVLLLNNSAFGKIVLTRNGSEVLDRNPNMTYLELSHNGLDFIQRNSFHSLKNLKTLLLNGNRLNSMSFNFTGLLAVERINISKNNIQFLDSSSLEALEHIQNVRPIPRIKFDVRNNPLECSCKTLQTLLYLTKMTVDIFGLRSTRHLVTCINGTGHVVSLLNETKKLYSQCSKIVDGVIVAFCVYVFCVITFGLGAIVRRCKNQIQYYTLLSIYLFRRDHERGYTRQFIFDAFVSYHHSNAPFVHRNIIDKLEDGPDRKNYSLCIHERNFRPGTPISVNIVEAILKSKKTILCVSSAYLKSGWCEFETNFAHSNSVTWHESNVILLVHPAVLRRGRGRLPLSLVALLDTVTYLEWPTDDYSRKVFLLKLRQILGCPLERPLHFETVLLV